MNIYRHPNKDRVSIVNTYACTIITIISKDDIATASGTDTNAPTPIPAITLLNNPVKINTKDTIAKIAMCPPVIFAAKRIVSAKRANKHSDNFDRN